MGSIVRNPGISPDGPLVASRWAVIAASLCLQICGGAMYAFPVYSEQLRITLNYAQWQVSSLALASNIGNFCNIPSGIVLDRFGVRVTVLCGIVVNFLGYFLLYLVATETIAAPYTVVFGISVLWGNGSGWFDTAVMGVNMSNFPEQRGIVVGLLKSFFGLSSAMLSLLYFAFFNALGAPQNADNFILFLAVGLSSIGLCAVPIVNHTPKPLPESLGPGRARTRLLFAYANVVILATALGLISLAAADIFNDGLLPETPPYRYRILTAVVGGVFALFFFLPAGAGPHVYRSVPAPRLRGCSCCRCSKSTADSDPQRRKSTQVRFGAPHNAHS